MKRFIKEYVGAFLAVAVIAGVAYAATKGDQNPFAFYGIVQITSYDGGTPAQVPLKPNQNAVAIRNFTNDGGTTATVFCGFNTSVTDATGFPIKDQETLSLDLVAITQNAAIAATPGLTDGGVTVTAGSLLPKIYCVTAPGTAAKDIHYILVK